METKINLLCVLDGMNHPPRTGGDQAVLNALNIMQYNVNLHLLVVHGTSNNISFDKLQHKLCKAKISMYNIGLKNKYEWINAFFYKVRRNVQILAGQKSEILLREDILSTNFKRYAYLYKFMNEYITQNRIDIVQFEFARALYWGGAIYVPVKKVFVQHEIQYIVKAQRFHGRNLTSLEKIRCQIERDSEIDAMNHYDAIITLSEDDTEKILKDGVYTNVFSSFAKVQYRKGYLSDFKKCKKIDLVFVGPSSHEPNSQGMSWFVENVWNKISLTFPDVRLHIVGKWDEHISSKWKKLYSNIIFEGFIDDLGEMLCNKILIVPIFEGSGIRMKILEAANVGTTFVGTSIGAEGLGFVSGENCLIADNATDFFEALKLLLTSKEKLNIMAKNAYRHAITDFSDERFLATRMNAYLNILKR